MGGFVASALGTKNSADAAKEAGKIQARSADKSIAFQRESRDLARKDLQPFRRFW